MTLTCTANTALQDGEQIVWYKRDENDANMEIEADPRTIEISHVGVMVILVM